MKPLLATLALVAAASLTACSGTDDQIATDPAGSTDTTTGAETTAADTMPTAVPASPGKVRTLGLVTVIDHDGPEVCLGPTTRIYPPQCTGPALVGWTWDDTAQVQDGVRFGSYALTGTWDGSALSVTAMIPAALYDAVVPAPTTLPTAATTYTPDELAATAQTLGARLPGVAGAAPDDQGHVLVEVTYDDGSLQAWADREYGAGVVVVQGRLVDAGR